MVTVLVFRYLESEQSMGSVEGMRRKSERCTVYLTRSHAVQFPLLGFVNADIQSRGEGLTAGQDLVGGDECCTQRHKFLECLPAFIGIQGLDRIANDRDAPPALK